MSSIDLRSDTVTKPTNAMRTAMMDAVVGDDVYNEDPTVILLQDRVARLFQKEDALFIPSGTMCNLIAILCWCNGRDSELIVGDKSHIFLYEQSGACQYGGVSFRTIPNLNDGTMDIAQIADSIRDDDIHEPVTRLICIENTHNVCGGKVLPLTFLEKLKTLALKKHIPVHLDGARLWNAIEALDVEPYELTNYVDSVSICLSKGLGCPVGSLLIGTKDFINKARRIRKSLGGGMRQAGVLAAAGLIALQDFTNGILAKDHINTQRLANAMKSMEAFKVRDGIDTNIIFAEIVKYPDSWNKNSISSNVSKLLKQKDIYISAWSPLLIRLVVHRDISDEDITKVITELQNISIQLIQ